MKEPMPQGDLGDDRRRRSGNRESVDCSCEAIRNREILAIPFDVAVGVERPSERQVRDGFRAARKLGEVWAVFVRGSPVDEEISGRIVAAKEYVLNRRFVGEHTGPAASVLVDRKFTVVDARDVGNCNGQISGDGIDGTAPRRSCGLDPRDGRRPAMRVLENTVLTARILRKEDVARFVSAKIKAALG